MNKKGNQMETIIKKDCFAYDSSENNCTALKICMCEKCKFYQEKEDYANRLFALYGIREPRFLT